MPILPLTGQVYRFRDELLEHEIRSKSENFQWVGPMPRVLER